MNRIQISPTPLNSTPKTLQNVDLGAPQVYEVKGFLPFINFPRLMEELMLEGAQAQEKGINWEFKTWIVENEGVPNQFWLEVVVSGQLPIMCQRCLSVYNEHIDVHTQFLVLDTEEEVDAYPLDEDSLDVLALNPQFNLLNLIEDEALLALPLIPKHPEGQCANTGKSLSKSGQNTEKIGQIDQNFEELKKPNPFLVLQKLKLDK